MGKIVSKRKLSRALHHTVPPACDRSYQPGENVLVWTEKIVSNRIAQWLGSIVIESVVYDKKLVYVRDSTIGPARPFHVAQVKPYFTPQFLSDAYMTEVNKSLNDFRSPPSEDNILLTEILSPFYDRSLPTGMNESKKEDVRNLMKRGTFKDLL